MFSSNSPFITNGLISPAKFKTTSFDVNALNVDKPGEYKYGVYKIPYGTNIGVFSFQFEFDQIPYEGTCHAVMIKTDQ